VLSRTTLKDLVHNEEEMTAWVGHLVNISDEGAFAPAALPPAPAAPPATTASPKSTRV